MKSRSKSYTSVAQKVSAGQVLSLEDGVKAVLEMKRAKFDEAVEIHLVMNLKGTKGPQSVRGSVLLPKPVSKEMKVVVLTDDESKLVEAREAGADMVGGADIVDAIKHDGGLEADIVIATPDFMRVLAPVAKILGPKGLMPSPKNGTTTTDIARMVKEFKAGKSEFRMDKTGVVHQSVGRVSFTPAEIVSNIRELLGEIEKQKPEKVKGDFVKTAYLALTQSPSIKVRL